MKQATPFPPPPITLPLQNQSSYYTLTSILPIPSLELECPEEAHLEGGSPTVPRAQLIEKQSVWRAVTTSLRATRASLSYQYFLWHVNHAFLPLFLICWHCLTCLARFKGLLSFSSTMSLVLYPVVRICGSRFGSVIASGSHSGRGRAAVNQLGSQAPQQHALDACFLPHRSLRRYYLVHHLDTDPIGYFL